MSFTSIINARLLFFLTVLSPIFGSEQSDLSSPKNPTEKVNFSIEFLSWLASQEEASIWTDSIKTQGNHTTWAFPSFNFNWDHGFRLGAGYNVRQGLWDLAFYWSRFQTDAKAFIPSHPNTVIQPEFFAGFLSGANPQSVGVHWDLLFNMFDWELGKNYWASQNLSLRPFIGLKGGWIYQSIQAHYYDLIIDLIFPTQNVGKEHLKNNFWGIGPLGGINTKWKVSQFDLSNFNLFGDFSLASLWGNWSCSDHFKNTLSQTYSVITKNSSLGALMFRGVLGIGWEGNFQKSRSQIAIRLGYETQLWINQLRISTFQLQRLHHDLTFQGFTLNALCNF